MAFQNQPGCGCCGESVPTDCAKVLGCLKPDNVNRYPVVGATVEFLTSGDVVLTSCETSMGVDSATVTNGGTGYTSTPTVAITGGGGSGATAHAHVFSGEVNFIVIDNPGSGYTSAPTATIAGGGGTGATATAAIASKCCASPGATPAKIRVTPPAGSGYAATTVARSSNNQTITLSPLAGWTCSHQGCCPTSEDPATPPWQQVLPPTTILVNDGFSTVSLAQVTGTSQWIGCATRTASSGFADCTTPGIERTANVDMTVFFSLTCISPGLFELSVSCGGFGAAGAGGLCTNNDAPVASMDCNGSYTATCCQWFVLIDSSDATCIPTFSATGSASITINTGLWYIYGTSISVAFSG